MPWNDNANPGPWGAPPPGDGDRKDTPARRPQGGGGGGGGGRGPRGPGGPDFGANFDRFGRRMRDMMGGPGGPRPAVIAAIVGGAFGLWALSGIYIVQPNEEAVVTTFGAYSGNQGPGLNYHLPYPIQHVEKVPVTSLQRVDVGGTGNTDLPEESLMLTRDENIVDLDFAVTWRVTDPDRFVFTVKEPESSIKAVAESAMREAVGTTELNPILTSGRGTVQRRAAELMQRILDSWGAGVTVVEVQIRSAQVPREVIPAFRDLANAEQDRVSAVNEATTYRNRVVAEARGDAARITQSAEGYREQAVRLAQGEASRFNAILNEYRRAPGATRDRLYIETMQRVLAGSNKVIIDGEGASAPIILPPDIFRPRGQQQQQQSAPPAEPQATQPQARGSR